MTSFLFLGFGWVPPANSNETLHTLNAFRTVLNGKEKERERMEMGNLFQFVLFVALMRIRKVRPTFPFYVCSEQKMRRKFLKYLSQLSIANQQPLSHISHSPAHIRITKTSNSVCKQNCMSSLLYTTSKSNDKLQCVFLFSRNSSGLPRFKCNRIKSVKPYDEGSLTELKLVCVQLIFFAHN